MSKTIYDKKSNTLHIVKDESVELEFNQESIEKKRARGFVVTVVSSEEELKEIQAGNNSKLQLSPVLAGDENEAIEMIRANGKIPLNVTNYEFLKLQMGLIEDLAKIQDVEIIEADLFVLKRD
jgi:hypothetical protein